MTDLVELAEKFARVSHAGQVEPQPWCPRMSTTTSNFGTRGQFHVIDDTTHQTAVAHDKHRKAARVIVAQAIDTTPPDDLHDTAREVCQILGLLPSPPPARPARQRGEPGWNHPSRKATK